MARLLVYKSDTKNLYIIDALPYHYVCPEDNYTVFVKYLSRVDDVKHLLEYIENVRHDLKLILDKRIGQKEVDKLINIQDRVYLDILINYYLTPLVPDK